MQATAALDISSSVCLAIKYQSQTTHTHTHHFPPLSLRLRDTTVLAGEHCVGHKQERKTNCSFLGETFQLETRVGEKARTTEGAEFGAVVSEQQKSVCAKNVRKEKHKKEEESVFEQEEISNQKRCERTRGSGG